jgi:hypothetical protein
MLALLHRPLRCLVTGVEGLLRSGTKGTMQARYERIRHDLLTELKVGDHLVLSTYKVGTGDPTRKWTIVVHAIQNEWVRCQHGLWHHLADSDSRFLATNWHTKRNRSTPV